MFDKPSIAHGVASALSMLTTIDLDDKPFLSTNKIDNVSSDRLLTDEFIPAQ